MWSPVISSRSLTARGIFALIFGIIALFMPGSVVLGLTLLVGAYCLVSGIATVVASMKKNVEGRGWLIFEAAVGILAGVVIFTRPLLSIVTLTYVIAAWAIITGILQITGAFVLRKYIHGEGFQLLSGILTVALGFLIMARPIAGAYAMAWMLGVYGLVFGASLIVAGGRVRRLEKSFVQTEKEEERPAA